MAGPTPQTEGTRSESEQIVIAPRTLALATNFASARLPEIPHQDLQPLVQAAANNDQQGFNAMLRASLPRADAAATYADFRRWLDLAGRIGESIDRWKESHRRQDHAAMESEGHSLSRHAAQGASMGISGMGTIILQEANSQITDPQAREDFARAAIGYGFAASDVMSVFGDLATPSRERSRERAEAFSASLQQAAVDRTQELMRRIQELQEQQREVTDPGKRRALELERQQMLTEFGRLTGPALATRVADQWFRNPDAPQTDSNGRQVRLTAASMETSAREETEHIIDLHSGRLNRVRIEKVA